MLTPCQKLPRVKTALFGLKLDPNRNLLREAEAAKIPINGQFNSERLGEVLKGASPEVQDRLRKAMLADQGERQLMWAGLGLGGIGLALGGLHQLRSLRREAKTRQQVRDEKNTPVNLYVRNKDGREKRAGFGLMGTEVNVPNPFSSSSEPSPGTPATTFSGYLPALLLGGTTMLGAGYYGGSALLEGLRGSMDRRRISTSRARYEQALRDVRSGVVPGKKEQEADDAKKEPKKSKSIKKAASEMSELGRDLNYLLDNGMAKDASAANTLAGIYLAALGSIALAAGVRGYKKEKKKHTEHHATQALQERRQLRPLGQPEVVITEV